MATLIDIIGESCFSPECFRGLLAGWIGGEPTNALASATKTWQDDPSEFEDFSALLFADVWSSKGDDLWETDDAWQGNDDYVSFTDPHGKCEYSMQLITSEAWEELEKYHPLVSYSPRAAEAYQSIEDDWKAAVLREAAKYDWSDSKFDGATPPADNKYQLRPSDWDDDDYKDAWWHFHFEDGTLDGYTGCDADDIASDWRKQAGDIAQQIVSEWREQDERIS